jgi:hypothetical protein
LLEECTVIVVLQVRRDPELVPVDAEVVGAPAIVIEGGSPAAGVVAAARSLYLYNVCAKIAEQHRAQGTGEDSGEIEDFDTV